MCGILLFIQPPWNKLALLETKSLESFADWLCFCYINAKNLMLPLKNIYHLPLFNTDYVLSSLWVLFIIGGIVTQKYLTRNESDFPTCPYKSFRERRNLLRMNSSQVRERIVNFSEEERTPLVGDLWRGREPSCHFPQEKESIFCKSQETTAYSKELAVVDEILERPVKFLDPNLF